ncbi:hypothetical protein B0H13DRAFT_1868214 [Mycena leptocephala]|nr:hypothetical protein B0H13DRAFT_1868214 [Mycena leptocephala]
MDHRRKNEYGHHFPTATRLETRAPVPFDHPWCESISEGFQLANDTEAAATTSYPTNDPFQFLDLFLSDLYDKDTIIEDTSQRPDLWFQPNSPHRLRDESFGSASEPISLGLPQYISPYRTVTLQTHQGLTFATEYKRPPVQATWKFLGGGGQFMKNQRHYLVTLIAVSQEMANLAAPLGNEEERHKRLGVNSGGDDGNMSMLRWEAIENPVTYAAQF